MVQLTDEEFEQTIADALDSIPQHLLDAMENVVVLTQDEPEEEQLEYAADGTESENGDLLGLYEGLPLTERGYDYGDCFGDITVIHEVGHYFGMDEDQIANMGFE